MIIKYSAKLIEKIKKDKGIDLFDFIEKRPISNLVAYVIDSKYRTSVTLKDWIKEQVDIPETSLLEIAENIPTVETPDKQVIEVLKWIKTNISYIGDLEKWKITEKWQEAKLTLQIKTGDCEDGVILMYVLCRLKGVSANRLFIWAGGTVGGGHCCLFYKPESYPLNFVNLDWCYNSNNKTIEARNLFTFIDKEIIEEKSDETKLESKYLNTWFMFNEEISYSKIRNKKIADI